ncbi:MAG: DNA repair protein RecN [Mariprofundaceae bacterium]|nr:DNA repair protein RecN [Mariprofundaceae bacterium]
MLDELTVRQFALIEETQISFSPGMTVFTGETGAGKSILVDALGAVFGARASSDWVRHGAGRAEVIATWTGHDHRLDALLQAQDMEADDALIIRRIITADGRSRAWVNGTPVPLKLLQQIGDICLDLHGQHEHQALMRQAFQRQLLDSQLPDEVTQAVREAYQRWRDLREQLEMLQAERDEAVRQETWLREELKRLQALQLEEGLEACLQADVEAGRHHAQIQQAAAEALQWLEDGETSVRSLLAQATHQVSAAGAYHEGLRESEDLLVQMDAILGELAPTLRNVLDSTFDDAELRRKEERLMELHEAMRRHQVDEAGLLALLAEWEEKVSRLDTAAWDEEALQKQCEAAAADYRRRARALTGARVQAGKKLAGTLRPFLDRLALAGMQVRVDVEADEDTAAWTAHGWDTVGIMVMSNPGEPFRALAAVASGGELSRFVLALKGCGALADAPGVAVFDEVDTGIGGETAWCVGELLAAMGRERQVLVVSHLPQVAACADHHICIRKEQKGERTVTHLGAVHAARRLEEVARMLGGADRESLQHAEKMLARGHAAAGG